MITWRSRVTRDNLFKAEQEKRTFVVYDLETTGLSADRDKIIQMSGIKFTINGKETVEIERFDHYINPGMPVPPKITEITGITDEMVFNKPTEEVLFPIIKDFFGENNVISGYNVEKFDNRFMENLYKRNGAEWKPHCTVDVIEMARDNVAKEETENFKLETMANLFGVNDGLSFHNSMDDVTATKRLLMVFLHLYKETYNEDEGLIGTAPQAKEGKKEVTIVHNLRYWEGYRGFSRIYISTNLGDFYYDIRKHLWEVNAKNNPYKVEEVDMETLRYHAMKKCGATSEDDFVKRNVPRKTKEIVEVTTVTAMRYWERTEDSGKTYHRIYITTDIGTFYFDIDKRKWFSNGGDVNVDVDMEKLKTLCFEKAEVSNEDEFCMYR